MHLNAHKCSREQIPHIPGTKTTLIPTLKVVILSLENHTEYRLFSLSRSEVGCVVLHCIMHDAWHGAICTCECLKRAHSLRRSSFRKPGPPHTSHDALDSLHHTPAAANRRTSQWLEFGLELAGLGISYGRRADATGCGVSSIAMMHK